MDPAPRLTIRDVPGIAVGHATGAAAVEVLRTAIERSVTLR